MKKVSVSVIGSWREHDDRFVFDKENRDFEIFKKSCYEIGRELAWCDYVDCLVVSVSNDHIPEQRSSKVLSDGSIVPKYLFEHTADYWAMIGFINHNGSYKKVKVLISNTMMNGGHFEEVPKISIAPFWDREETLVHNAKSCRLRDFGDVIDIVNVKDEKLRSVLLKENVVNALKDESNVPLVIFVGGGKATDAIYDKIQNSMDVLPVPYFGSASLTYFAEKRNEDVLGKKYNEIYSNIPHDDVLNYIICPDVERHNANIPIKAFKYSDDELLKEVAKIIRKTFKYKPEIVKDRLGNKSGLRNPVYEGSIQAGGDVTIIIDSTNCLNTIKNRYDKEWAELQKIVEQNDGAKMPFKALEEELELKKPNKEKVKTLLEKIGKALPFAGHSVSLLDKVSQYIEHVL
jgi:hypothetical protein